MNPFTMVVAIVLIIAVATVARALISGRGLTPASSDLHAHIRVLEARIAALEERQSDPGGSGQA